MVVNIMMGIRMAVGRVMMEPNRPLCPNDYTMKEKMTIVSPKHDNDDSKVTLIFLLSIFYRLVVLLIMLLWFSVSYVNIGVLVLRNICFLLVLNKSCVFCFFIHIMYR